MTLRRIMIAGLCATALACGKSELGPPGLNAECVRNADCAEPFTCMAGVCTIQPWQECEPSATRCNGNVVETCGADRSTWTPAATECATGCANGACRASACSPLARRCTYAKDDQQKNIPGTATIERCDPSGVAFDHFQSCPFGCLEEGATVRCVESECEPFSTVCKPGDPTKLLTCNKYGVAVPGTPTVPLYTETACSASSSCVAGKCVQKVCQVNRGAGGSINFRQERCSGNTKEVCNDTETAFQPVEICALGCDYNAVDRTARCGVPNCRTGPNPTDFALAGDSRCKPNDATSAVLQTCNARGTEWVDSTCASPTGPAVCVGGQCFPKVCSVTRSGTTVTRQERCAGQIREVCDDTQSFFKPILETATDPNPCPYGCFIDASNRAKCKPAVCAWNGGIGPEERCTQVGTSSVLESCNGLGEFEPVQYCPAGCGSPAAGQAECLPMACTPLSSRCALDAGTNLGYVELCRADGTRFERSAAPCAQGCGVTGSGAESRAFCRVFDVQCVAGEIRCQGDAAQACVRLANGATEWRVSDQCLGSCNAGACDAVGACGCARGPAAELPLCGVDARQPVKLQILSYLPTGVANYPCDGISRFLLHTDPITSSTGAVVPDGTLVTFTHDGTDTLLGSADADPDMPGLQRPTLRGRARVLLNAPLAAACGTGRSIRVSATVEGTCSGWVALPFQPQSAATRNIYIAEDFSTGRLRDWALLDAAGVPRQAALWDTQRGVLSARLAADLGTGADGDLIVGAPASTAPAPEVRNLNVTKAIQSFHVRAIGEQDVTTDSVMTPFAPGDELLLISVHGSANAGNYEFKKVAAAESGRVIFTEPVRFTYGATTNANLTGQRVLVQRVPQYNNVTVWHNGTLTVNGPTIVTPQVGQSAVWAQSSATTGSGILAFRARGTVRVLGKINVDQKGLPPGRAYVYSTAQTAHMDKFQLGTGNSAPGGGIVYIAAAKVSFKEAGNSVVFPNSAEISAVTSLDGGRGGAIWLATGSLEVGAEARPGTPAIPMIRATGTLANGYIRIDHGALDTATTHYVNPSQAGRFYVGQNGGFWAQSTTAYREVRVGASIRSATLLGAIGGVGQSEVRLGGVPNVSLFQGFVLEASAVDGQDPLWAQLSSMVLQGFRAAEDPRQGTQFKWRVRISPSDDQPHELLGVAIRVVAQ